MIGFYFQAYELSTLTGTQVMLLVASETGHVYTFATRKLQPMITSEAGKTLIQTCLNSPDQPGGPTGGGGGGGSGSADQRMSATGYEETELTYNVPEDVSEQQQKVRQMMYNSHYSSVAAALMPQNHPYPTNGGTPTPTSSSSSMTAHNPHQGSPYGGHHPSSPSPSPMHYGVTSLSPATSGVHSPGPHLGGAPQPSSHSPPFLVPHQHQSVAGR